MELPIWITVATQLYNASKSKTDTSFLPSGPLILFTNFKAAYDRKDPRALSWCIDPNFQGDFYDANTKEELISVFRQLFKGLPPFTNPNLSIKLYFLHENSPSTYEAIISFNANLTVAGMEIPLTDYDAGKVTCRLEKQGTDDTWKITKIDHYYDD